MERQLFQHVCDVLDRAGFLMRDGVRGLTVVSTPQGVRVGWQSGQVAPHAAIGIGQFEAAGGPTGFGRGIQAVMVVAVATVLEQAGYCVDLLDTDLLVTMT